MTNKKHISPEEVLTDLALGNARFLSGVSAHATTSSVQKLKHITATGVFPKAIVLCCSDSRAPVETVFDQDVGDLFVIRVAGNVVAPSLVGSVEFAASTYGVKLVVVMGHTHCGAVKATLDYCEHADNESIANENIHDIVGRIKPHIFPISRIADMPYDEKMRQAVVANVLASVGQLTHASRIIETMVETGDVVIRGAVLNLDTGKVDFIQDA